MKYWPYALFAASLFVALIALHTPGALAFWLMAISFVAGVYAMNQIRANRA